MEPNVIPLAVRPNASTDRGNSGLIQAMVIACAALAVLVPGMYFVLRKAEVPVAPPPAAHAQMGMDGAAPAARSEQVQRMVERLAARLEKEPDNATGWQMLARSYAVLGRFADAAKAYARATALLPRDAELLADYADVVAMAQSGSFVGEPARLIGLALAADPMNPKALTLAGTEALKRNDATTALRYWEKALPLVPADSDLAGSIRSGIETLKQRSAGSR